MMYTNEIQIDINENLNSVNVWGKYEMVDKLFGDEVVGREPQIEDIVWGDLKYSTEENQLIQEYINTHFTELSEKLIDND
jgi:hypothetical protein